MRFSKAQKKFLDQYINYAVKEGYLDEYKAGMMSYKDKQNYFDWSDMAALTAYARAKEEEK